MPQIRLGGSVCLVAQTIQFCDKAYAIVPPCVGIHQRHAYFPTKLSTAIVMLSTPVLMVGSGTGK